MQRKDRLSAPGPSFLDKSIAVLPFVNMSADPSNEYFSDGMTEEIINALTKIHGLKVIARTSSFAFKDKNIDVRTIGRQLGVTTVLEGSVRKSQNRLRITAQLIRTDDGSHLWSRNFDREMADVFVLQDEISLLIADQIRENYGHFDIQDHLTEAPTDNITAYKLYLKGRHHHLRWNPVDFELATQYYKQSLEEDPTFALPAFGAGMTYSLMTAWSFIPYEEGVQTARKYLALGLEMDRSMYISHYAEATFNFWGLWNFKEVYANLQRAIALNPASTDLEEGLAELYTCIGYFEKAMEHTQNILQRNPLSPNHHYTKGNIYYLTGEFEQSIQEMEKALQVDPGFWLAIEVIALCYVHLQAFEKLDAFLKAHPQAEQPTACLALYHLMHAQEKEMAIDWLDTHAQTAAAAASMIPWTLYLNVHLGNDDVALNLLEEGVQQRKGQHINFRNDPLLQPLQEHVRFQKLIQATFDPSRLPTDEVPTAPDKARKKQVLSAKEIDYYLKALKDLVERQEIFTDPSLTLKGLAEQIALHPNKLSHLINEQLGKNFNEYINRYRLAAFKAKARQPENSHLTLLGLAYESGFNSKTVFNAFFKKQEGMTPRAWLKQSDLS
ncbi:MAG: helix-turn-helix domain-containing protein [Bacteroidota bacterium]